MIEKSENIEINPHDIVLLLNSILALDEDVMKQLMNNRPRIKSDQLRQFLHMEGNKASFLSVINNMIYESGYMIGADCDIEDGEIREVLFFHLLKREKDNDA